MKVSRVMKYNVCMYACTDRVSDDAKFIFNIVQKLHMSSGGKKSYHLETRVKNYSRKFSSSVKLAICHQSDSPLQMEARVNEEKTWFRIS